MQKRNRGKAVTLAAELKMKRKKYKYPYLSKLISYDSIIAEAKETPNAEIYLEIMESSAKRRYFDFVDMIVELSHALRMDPKKIVFYVLNDNNIGFFFLTKVQVFVPDYGLICIDSYTLNCFKDRGLVRPMSEIKVLHEINDKVIYSYEYIKEKVEYDNLCEYGLKAV